MKNEINKYLGLSPGVLVEANPVDFFLWFFSQYTVNSGDCKDSSYTVRESLRCNAEPDKNQIPKCLSCHYIQRGGGLSSAAHTTA